MSTTLADSLIEESNEAYHQRDGISASRLKSMNKGWRWYEGEHITRTIARKESPSMRLGTAIHAAILEPDAFGKDYIVCPAECSDRRTKAHKEWATTTDGREILSASEAVTIQACREAVETHPVARRILTASGINERSFTYTDEASGVPCRVRFDRLAGLVICDIKTTDCLDGDSFAKAIATYRYDLQAAHYLEGLHTLTGDKYRFVFIAVETSPPHRCRVYQLGEGDLVAASERRAELLSEYARRIESGDWSDPLEGELQTVYLPNWFYKRAT